MTADLGFNVFTAPAPAIVGERPRPFGPPMAWNPMTSTLIFGEREAVLIDTLATVPEAVALADWVALHERDLTTIYITHGHIDHFAGLSVLLRRFPTARAIATPEAVRVMEKQIPRMSFFRRLWPGRLPVEILLPDPYEHDSIEVEGRELRILALGHTDTAATTAVHVPSIDLVVGGDVFYNRCHMYVAETTAESRENWIGALDTLLALKPRFAVAGHKKPGAPDVAQAIADSRQYLIEYGRLLESGIGERELYDRMGDLHPHWDNHQAWLTFGLTPLRDGA